MFSFFFKFKCVPEGYFWTWASERLSTWLKPRWGFSLLLLLPACLERGLTELGNWRLYWAGGAGVTPLLLDGPFCVAWVTHHAADILMEHRLCQPLFRVLRRQGPWLYDPGSYLRLVMPEGPSPYTESWWTLSQSMAFFSWGWGRVSSDKTSV